MGKHRSAAPIRRLPAVVRVRLLRRVGAVRVYLIDGERVRDELDVDFTMGGSHPRWSFIPRGEVWVDALLSPRDREATVVHELRERGLMLRGVEYAPAHDAANAAEREYRRRR